MIDNPFRNFIIYGGIEMKKLVFVVMLLVMMSTSAFAQTRFSDGTVLSDKEMMFYRIVRNYFVNYCDLRYLNIQVPGETPYNSLSELRANNGHIDVVMMYTGNGRPEFGANRFDCNGRNITPAVPFEISDASDVDKTKINTVLHNGARPE